MDFDRLRYFCTVAETGSLRRAAEILRISPPALSKALRVLEAESGRRLTLPAGRGIAITDEGKEFAARASAVLREAEALRAGAGAAEAAARRPLRLGSFEVFTTYFLGPLARDHLGDVPLVLHELVAGHLERALIEREVDLGLTYVPVPSADIHHQEVAHVEMGIYGRRDAFGNVAFGELPFAVPVTPLGGAPDRVRGLDGWPDDEIARSLRYQVTLMESALELCRQGLAVAYIPRFVARLHNERAAAGFRLQHFESPKGLGEREARRYARRGQQTVYLLRRKTDAESDAYRRVARAVRAICRDR